MRRGGGFGPPCIYLAACAALVVQLGVFISPCLALLPCYCQGVFFDCGMNLGLASLLMASKGHEVLGLEALV